MKKTKSAKEKPRPVKKVAKKAARSTGKERSSSLPRDSALMEFEPKGFADGDSPNPNESTVENTAPSTDVDDSALPKFMIAGIGASAGGLEACSALLEALPADLGMPLIIVQHLAPLRESFLTELLSTHSKMKVEQITEGVRVEPNTIYVIPPNTHMSIEGGLLHLQARPDDRTQHMPIDSFFRSLAEYAQNRAIGIVLSGTASDGAVGMREIKGAGGITIAQNPNTAKSDGMPRSAIATGAVDLILAPHEIAAELVRIARHPLVPAAARIREELPGLDEHLPRVFSMLRAASGVDFSHYKLPTIRRRMQRRMVLHKLDRLQDYIRFLQQNPSEVNALYQDILIHVTRFFRDPESFDVLRKKAFDPICHDRHPDIPIRIWVPGCATGEEAYSVAIALQEYLGDKASGTPIQVFGTDVSDIAVDHARAGVYSDSITADVSPERLRRFFSRIDGSYRINKAVRDVCIFARQDITRDPPFSKLDLILCRNVLIYLGANLQKRLMATFHYALRNTGFLMLGNAETIGTATEYFSMVDKHFKLYSRKLTSERIDTEMPAGNYMRKRPAGAKADHAAARPSSIQSEVSQVILSRYSPAGVVVDEDLQVVQFRGQTGKFLEPPAGEPSLSLFKLVREGLLYGVRSAIHEARKIGETVRRDGLRVRVNDAVIPVAIEVVPLRGVPGERHLLILFEDGGKDGQGATSDHRRDGDKKHGKKKASPKPPSRIRELESELSASREYLQSVIQDLEAANEELQSANEEVLSANEELQSTNEELNTLNEELQSRNEELSHVNSDLINLLASVQIAIVMVTSDLRIRRYTPMAERVLNLIPTDIGRRISDIKPNIDCPNLEGLLTESIDSVSVRESECRDRHGKLYSLRIRPYKNLENRIDGAIIALFEAQGGNGADSTSADENAPKSPPAS